MRSQQEHSTQTQANQHASLHIISSRPISVGQTCDEACQHIPNDHSCSMVVDLKAAVLAVTKQTHGCLPAGPSTALSYAVHTSCCQTEVK
jgi:hypothetical protein